MKKILISTFIVTLLGLLSTFGYYFFKSKTVLIEAPIATTVPTVSVKPNIYKNDTLGFQIELPSDLPTNEKTGGKFVIIGDKILVYELDSDPEKCTGVCSIITKKEDTTVNGNKMRYLEGYWDELGEENAQSFVSYVLPVDKKYLVFMLQELPTSATFEKGRSLGQISQAELEKFKSIINTIKLQ